MKKLEIESKFLQGLRVTDPKTMEVAQMVLCGSINKDIAGMISSQPGVRGAIGLCGLDGKLIQAKAMVKTAIDEVTGKEIQLDLGLVGDPTIVNTQLLRDLLNLSLVPVCAPVGCNEVGGGSLNINADTAAGNVAEALKVGALTVFSPLLVSICLLLSIFALWLVMILIDRTCSNASSPPLPPPHLHLPSPPPQADRLLLLTDIVGVLDKEKKLIETIPTSAFSTLTADGTITGGMIPKLENAVLAASGGVGVVSIMDGRVRHCILKALSGEVFGTRIVQG